MKKLLTTFSFFVICITMTAQLTSSTLVGTYDYQYLSLEVSDEGNVNFCNVWCNWGDEYNATYFIFDDNFSLLKTIELNGFDRLTSDFWTMDPHEVVVTKNVFVKNNKWCFVGRLVDQDEYVIMDEDGKVVCLLSDIFPGEDLNETVEIEYFLGGVTTGRLFITFAYLDYYNVYDLNNLSGVQSVRPVRLNAYPNPLHGAQTFTVELERPADSKTVLVINDMNGRTVKRQRIEDGADKAVLRHSRFGRGQYIYTVIYGDGTSVSGKLLAD